MESFEVMRYGYTVFDYSRQYEQEWTDSVTLLMDILNITSDNKAGNSSLHKHYCSGTIGRDGKRVVDRSKYEHMKKYSLRSKAIPIDSIYEIIAFLDERALCAVSLVCKQWNVLANKHEIWSNLLLKKFSVRFDNIKVNSPATKADHNKYISGRKTTGAVPAKKARMNSRKVKPPSEGKLQQQQPSSSASVSAKMIYKEMFQAYEQLRRLKKVQPLKSTSIILGYSL